jgi:hypothetical protein
MRRCCKVRYGTGTSRVSKLSFESHTNSFYNNKVTFVFLAVAVAFEDKLVYNEELVSKVKGFFKKEDLSDPCFKLAYIPSTSQLNYGVDVRTGKPAPYPLVSVQNVFIFPGMS